MKTPSDTTLLTSTFIVYMTSYNTIKLFNQIIFNYSMYLNNHSRLIAKYVKSYFLMLNKFNTVQNICTL